MTRVSAPCSPSARTSVPIRSSAGLARRASIESIVLLRNEGGVLPLGRGGLGRLAVIGPNARRTTLQGGGSSRVAPHYQTNVLDALRAALGGDVEVAFAEGCTNFRRLPVLEDVDLEMETFTTTDLSGTSIAERPVRRPDFTWLGDDAPVPRGRPFSVRLSGTLVPAASGRHRFSLTCVGRARLLVDGKPVVDAWTAPEPGDSYFGFGNAEVAANAHGSFAFGDVTTSARILADIPGQFKVRASGGVRFATNAAETAGVQMLSGASQWLPSTSARIVRADSICPVWPRAECTRGSSATGPECSSTT